jgi:hypothetical protein
MNDEPGRSGPGAAPPPHGLVHGAADRSIEPTVEFMSLRRSVGCACVVLLCALLGAPAARAADVLMLGADGRARATQDPAVPAATGLPVRPARQARAGAPRATAAAKGPTVAGELQAPAGRGGDRPGHPRCRPRGLRPGAGVGAAPRGPAPPRAAGRAADGRRHRGGRAAHPLPSAGAVHDARPQPSLVDDGAPADGRAARRLRGLGARLAVLPGRGPAAPGPRELRQAQRALGGQALRRPPRRAARRAARAAGRARRRPRVGVLLHLRRREAALGVRARAGDRHPGAGPRVDPPEAQGGGPPRRPAGAVDLRGRAARGRRRRRGRRGALPHLLLRPRAARPQRVRAGRDRPARLRGLRERPPRPGALRGRGAGPRARDADLRHGRLVPVLRGSVKRESDLGYHRLLRGFLAGLCDRTGGTAYCTARDHFGFYETQPPVVEVVPGGCVEAASGASDSGSPRSRASGSRCRCAAGSCTPTPRA